MSAFTYGRGKRSQNRFAKAMNKSKKIARRSRHIDTAPSGCVSTMELAGDYAGQAIKPVVIEYKKTGNSDRTGAGRAVFQNRSMDINAMDLNYRTGDSIRPEHTTPQKL